MLYSPEEGREPLRAEYNDACSIRPSWADLVDKAGLVDFELSDTKIAFSATTRQQVCSYLQPLELTARQSESSLHFNRCLNAAWVEKIDPAKAIVKYLTGRTCGVVCSHWKWQHSLGPQVKDFQAVASEFLQRLKTTGPGLPNTDLSKGLELLKKFQVMLCHVNTSCLCAYRPSLFNPCISTFHTITCARFVQSTMAPAIAA